MHNLLSILLLLFAYNVSAEEIEVLVPNRSIAKNEIITEVDLSLATVEKRGNYLESIEGNVVVKARRNLEEGKPIKVSDVTIDRALVHKGDLVTVTFARKNLLIEIQGLALNNGAEGEVIKVKNLETNKILYGKVARGGIIELQ
jgi:flagella basal body P-ring formation protein FlgA